MENATLSPLEQKIYFASKEAKDGVISLETIKSWRLTDDATLHLIIHNMLKKGYIIKLKRGIYLNAEPGKQAIEEPFTISTYIFSGYNGFSSAMYIHKLTDMMPFGVYIVTQEKKSKKTIGQYSFESVPLGKRAFGSERVNNYIVSTIPKTIYDCLHKPLFAGGLPAVLKAIYEADMNKEQWKEFFYYVKKFEKDAFYQRLGYLLSLLPKKTKNTKGYVSLCKAHIKSNVYLFGRKKGRYVKEWKIIDNVGKEKLLSWWSYG